MRRALVLGFVILVGLAGTSWAETPVPSATASDGEAQLFSCAKPAAGAAATFKVALKPDVDLKDLVTWAMGFSCKKFLYGSVAASHTAKVTMITPGTMTASQAWGVFEAALHSMGLTVVAKGTVLEIVESPSAKDEALAIRKSFPDGGAAVVRLLLRPEHADVGDLASALELVKSKNGVVAPLPKLGAVLVTDDADHIARMQPLVTELDRPATSDSVFAIPLAHVDAASVVTTLTKLLDAPAAAGAATGAAPHLRLVADARTNALFLAGSAADYVRVKALAEAIDVDDGVESGAHLIRLRHARAKELAATLNTLLSGGGATAATAVARASTDAGGFAPSGPIRVTADEASNSLLVMASAHDASSLRALVEDMDAPIKQVYIEALVLEIDAGNEQQLGVSWHGGADQNGSLLIGGLQSTGLSSLDPTSAASATGLIGGVIGQTLTASTSILGSTIPSYALLLHATAHDSRVDILSAPHIMTLDNKVTKLSVGSNIPYRTSTATPLPTGQTQQGTVERKDIALALEITPHVSPPAPGEASSSQLITLDVKLDDSQIAGEDFGGGLGPTWKERKLETSAIMHDEESLVLGGLVGERIDDTVDKIPVLGDIPLLGALFRSTKKIRQKSNLLIIITPHVLDDSIEAREMLMRRLHERDEIVRVADDLERRVWQGDPHPAKMRGLLADIDATVHEVERDRAALAAAARPPAVKAGRIETSPPVDASPSAP
jgi:general secretion pathway protein D